MQGLTYPLLIERSHSEVFHMLLGLLPMADALLTPNNPKREQDISSILVVLSTCILGKAFRPRLLWQVRRGDLEKF